MHFLFFLLNDPPTTEISTLSLHDALPICGDADAPQTIGSNPARVVDRRCPRRIRVGPVLDDEARDAGDGGRVAQRDRKSTRLNSSHSSISYAVFCLKKKKDR